jgi:hypothetical protein
MASFRVSKRLAHEGTTWILGSGDLAARAALAIRMTHPGFTARRLFVQRTTAYVAQRLPGEPVNEAGVGTLSAAEVKRRLRWLPPASLSHGAYARPGPEPDRPRLICGHQFARGRSDDRRSAQQGHPDHRAPADRAPHGASRPRLPVTGEHFSQRYAAGGGDAGPGQ